MTLYFLIFGSLIGSRGTMDGISYMDFIVPGPGIDGPSSRTPRQHQLVSFFGAKFGRHVEELLVSFPMPNWVHLGGVANGVRGLMVGRHRDGDAVFLPRCACRVHHAGHDRIMVMGG
jgi:hypothetical protein